MSALVLPAPAKLNRMLHIVGRRADGYHELQTLFQFLDYGDELRLSRRDDSAITLSPSLPGVPDESNLVVRAAHLLQAETGCPLGVDVHLTKRLPLGGGLGGGSSNAATLLLGLNRLWQLKLPLARLAQLGLQLGADVPVFVQGRAAWAEGIGERLTPVTLDTPWFVVVYPGIEIATAAVFGAPQLTRNTPPITMARALQGGAPSWQNDCEFTVRQLYPPVAEALDWLGSRAPSMLTGSGSCLFARFTTESAARQLLADMPAGYTAFVARGLNHSPLHDALDR